MKFIELVTSNATQNANTTASTTVSSTVSTGKIVTIREPLKFRVEVKDYLDPSTEAITKSKRKYVDFSPVYQNNQTNFYPF